MLTYPVYFPRNRYSGRNEARRNKAYLENELIARVERYVNEQGKVQEDPFHIYSYAEIAFELRLDPEDVRRLCMVDGGHNGFTVIRPGLTYEQALAEGQKIAGGPVAT